MTRNNNIVKYLFYSLTGSIVWLGGLVCGDNNAARAQEVTMPLEIVQTAALSFGSFTVERGGGAVVVNERSGGCAPKGSVVMLKNLCEQGQFEIRGRPGAQMMIELIAGGSSTPGLSIENLKIYPADNMVTLGLDGKARIQVGGELVARGASPAASFHANYMVNVNYLQ